MPHLDVQPILIALIGAGLLGYVRDLGKAYKNRQNARSPEGRDSAHVTLTDQSLLVVARARDELEADNTRLRAQAEAERNRYDMERAAWDRREADYRGQIEALESKVRSILDELTNLKNGLDRRSTD